MLHLSLKSFATRLSFYVLSFTLIVFTVIMIVFYSYTYRKLTGYAIDYTQGQLKSVSAEIDGLLRTVETTLDQSVWIVEADLHNPDSLYKVITSVVENNDLIVGSSIAFESYYYKEKGKYFMPYASRQQDGKINVQVLGSPRYDYPCMDWYLIPKLKRQNYWSEPYYDKGGGNDMISTYSMPLYDAEGKLYAIFTANISLMRFTDMVMRLKPYGSGYTYLVSRYGSFLTHSDRNKIMNETIFSEAFDADVSEQASIGYEMQKGHTGIMRFNNKGNDSYAFYTSIPCSGWSVCTIYRSSVVLNELYHTTFVIVGLFFLGIILLFIVIYSVIRRQSRPLTEFSESARAIATGRFDIRLPVITSKDEINDLRNSLAYMQHSLADYVEQLRKTTAAKERIESELCIAHDIQMGMIPKTFPPFPERKDIDLQAVLYPAKEVGGDLYDFFINNGKLYFVIGDVSGKGIPASLFMAITRSLFRTLASKSDSPADIVSGMNNSISDNNETFMFVTLIVGTLDLLSGKLKVCNAGHNAPVFIHPNGRTEFIHLKTNLFVGISESLSYTDEEFILEKGTKIFLYTDGVTESENEQKNLYGDEHLLQTLSAHSRKDVKSLLNTIIKSVKAHAGDAEQNDDLTILIIHYNPNISDMP